MILPRYGITVPMICVALWCCWLDVPPVMGDEPKTVQLTPDFVENGSGENIDSPWFWEAPDPEDTLLFVTAKDNHLVEVWKFPFRSGEQNPLTDPDFQGGTVNGVGVDQDTDRLYVTGGGTPGSVFVYELPSLKRTMRFTNTLGAVVNEPNFGILHQSGEPTRLYISSGAGNGESVISIHRADSGNQIGMWYQPNEVEALCVDPFHRIVYVPDENHHAGVHAYHPDGRPFLKDGTNNFGRGLFESDAEGITYFAMRGTGAADDGTGFLIVSDQHDDQTQFELFDRITWEHLGTLLLEGVANTDGVASTQRPLPGYPHGLFVAVDDDTAIAGIGWHRILEAFGFRR